MKLKSWKTTIFGLLGAIGLTLNDLVTSGQVDNKTLIVSAVVSGLGFLAKDSNVTGG